MILVISNQCKSQLNYPIRTNRHSIIQSEQIATQFSNQDKSPLNYPIKTNRHSIIQSEQIATQLSNRDKSPLNLRKLRQEAENFNLKRANKIEQNMMLERLAGHVIREVGWRCNPGGGLAM